MATATESTGQSYIPTEFNLESALLINHRLEAKDIKNLISKIVIREGFHLKSLIADITVGDGVNFFESFQLIGQESIVLEFSRFPIINNDPQKIKLEFFISEYPEYARNNTNATQQAYTMRGISSYAFESKFKKISRAYNGSATSEVQKIITKDLHFNNFSINGIDSTSHKGTINIQEPLKAVEYFRKMAYDDKGAPFKFWQSINGIVQMAGLSTLMNPLKNKPMGAYVYLSGYVATPFTHLDYIERSVRIRQLKSKINMSKLRQSIDGGYASKVKILDYAKKTYTEKVYNYGDKSGTGPRTSTLAGPGKDGVLLSKSFKIGLNNDDALNNLPDAKVEYISKNSKANGNFKARNYSDDLIDGIGRINSFEAKLNTMVHNIELCGDFNLTTGRTLRLLFPKSMEAAAYKGYNPDDGENDHLDKLLSGIYLITSVNHVFNFTSQENVYTCELEVKKDSVFSKV